MLEPQKPQKGIVKYSLILAGLILIGIGAVGIVVPGLPTTIFLIAAAACFAKSSPCLHAWLLSHRWFGPIIVNWQESRSIPKKAKIMALSMMILACVYSWFMIDSLVILGIIYAVMLFPFVFVSRHPLSESSVIASSKAAE